MPVPVATQANWANIVQKDLSLVFTDQYRQRESMLGAVVKMKDAEQGIEYDQEGGDVGEMADFSAVGAIAFQTPTQGYRKSVEETQWALGVKFERRLMRNDLYGVTRDIAESLADSARDKREVIGAAPFVDGFSSAFTTGDSLSLFNSAHTNRQNSNTQSNTGTSAFSPAAVEATRLSISKFQTNSGSKMATRMDTLILPEDLHEKGYEYIKSSGKVDTANNNVNFHRGRYDLIVWTNYLTDTNNWFAVDSTLMKRRLIYRIWEDTMFFRSGEFDTLSAKFAVYFSVACSTAEWRWGFGQNVA